MNIAEISNQRFSYTNNLQKTIEKQQPTTQYSHKMKLASLPSTSHYLAFTGGYSLNLAQTIKNLDKLAERTSRVFPPNVREWAQLVLEEGNKAQQTLIDIHKAVYEGLLECDTLAQAKGKFPEFDSVISSETVSAKPGSFIDEYRAGNLDYFDADEDLSLQLLKLYWAKGFSLSDLRRYAGDKEMVSIMKKLNIPVVNPTYGLVLKLSDVEYNTRLMAEMKERRIAKLDRIAQETDGEPVYIKRGPLSEEHRRHISESLKRHFELHPEAILALSERQRKFYEDNPLQALLVHRVLLKAWSCGNSGKIKEAMSAFMKRYGVYDFDVNSLDNPIYSPNKHGALMKKFWLQNGWARESWSKNMTYAWAKVKEDDGRCYELRIVPKRIAERLKAWAAQRGVKIEDSVFVDKFYPNRMDIESPNNPYVDLCNEFTSSLPGGEQTVKKAYNKAVILIAKEVQEMLKKSKGQATRDLCQQLLCIIEEFVNKTAMSATFDELSDFFVNIRCKVILDFHPKLVEMMEDKLDKALETELRNITGKGIAFAFKRSQELLPTPDIRVETAHNSYNKLVRKIQNGQLPRRLDLNR